MYTYKEFNSGFKWLLRVAHSSKDNLEVHRDKHTANNRDNKAEQRIKIREMSQTVYTKR